MNPRQRNCTSQSVAAAQAKVLAARQALAAELETAAEDEPMHRYPHTIPQAASGTCTASGDSAVMEQALEQLTCQSRLLTDLLGAVNALTAATLAQNNK